MSVADGRGMGSSTASKNSNHYNRQNWETADFPILCETCLGDNPYVRMTKETHGRECKICERPFTVFRWCPGAGMRFKKTEVCQTCAKLKNVCQTCLLDLEYGLPTQVRDAALGLTDKMPTSDVNREYYTQNMEAALENGGGLDQVGTLTSGSKTTSQGGRELLAKLARTTPYYKRNRAHICSFWVKGHCSRGEECPYRHEKPGDPNDPLAKQNFKDRFYGTNDPVAAKIMKRSKTTKSLEAPADKSIMSLYIGGVEVPFVTKQDLQDYFYQFGEIRTISVLQKQKAAFIHFTSRDASEKAAAAAYGNLVIKGRSLKVLWGRAQGQKSLDQPEGKKALLPPGGGLGLAAPGQPNGNATTGFMPPAPPSAFMNNNNNNNNRQQSGNYYPSMDSQRMGARSAQPMKGGFEKGQKRENEQQS